VSSPTPRSPASREPSTGGIALRTIVSASAAPYGYTVSLWSSGALLIHFRGPPNVGEVFLFAAGALAGFSVVGLSARPVLQGSGPIDSPFQRVVAGALNWFSVGAAVGAVALIAEIASWAAWPLGSLAATVVFLLCSSAQLALVAGWASQTSAPRRSDR
jgi:hypothetical protein